MIDETLRTLVAESLKDWLPVPYDEALTAIYEIGLEKIGQDDIPNAYDDYTNAAIEGGNIVRASQRKAWAKACGVAE